MQGVFPKDIFTAAARLLRLQGGNDFLQQGDDIDGESAALAGARRFPIEKIKAPLSRAIENHQVTLAPGLPGPFLPLLAFGNFRA